MDDQEAAGTVLQHYGVRGMKWGIRKRRGGGSSRASKVVNALAPKGGLSSEDAIAFREIKEKARTMGTASLSNDEIRLVTNRMELEKKYAQLFPAPQSKKSKVAEFFVQDVLLGTGKAVAKDLAKDMAKHKVRSIPAVKSRLPAKEEKKEDKKEDK